MGSFFSSDAYAATAPSEDDSVVMRNSLVGELEEHLGRTQRLQSPHFSASWCGPCKLIEPAIHKMAKEYTEVDFVIIDVDEVQDVAQEYGVQAMPTFVLFKKGKELDRVVGAKTDELQKNIEKHRATQ